MNSEKLNGEKYVLNDQLELVNSHFSGNKIKNGVFLDSAMDGGFPYKTIFKMMTSINPQRKEKKKDKFAPEVIFSSKYLDKKDDMIVWLGHASFFIRIGGINILTDPVFRDLFTLTRGHKQPHAVNHFKNIDYILISHGHRDHLDVPTLKSILKNNPNAQILTALGIPPIIGSKLTKNIQEAAWYQSYKTQNDIKFTFLPALHWHRRSLNDFNQALWGSFLIEIEGKRVFFAGDSGYESHYQEIASLYGGFDVSILPIGAYSPSFMMRRSHMNPQEAFTAFKQMNGGVFIPMHYGTYDLSNEPASEPITWIRSLFKNEHKMNHLADISIGEEYTL